MAAQQVRLDKVRGAIGAGGDDLQIHRRRLPNDVADDDAICAFVATRRDEPGVSGSASGAVRVRMADRPAPMVGSVRLSLDKARNRAS